MMPRPAHTLVELLAALAILALLVALACLGGLAAYYNAQYVYQRNLQRNQDISYEAEHLQSPFGRFAPWYEPTDPPEPPP